MFISLGFLFFLSVVISLISIMKFKTISLVDFFVLFSWFYVFYRPLAIDYCGAVINRELYFWNSEYYVFGVLFSAIATVVFQVGAQIGMPSKQKIITGLNGYDLQGLYKSYRQLFFFVFAMLVFLWGMLFFIYGLSLFPWNRAGTGAASAGLPGFELVWPILRILLFLTIFLSLFLFMETKKKVYLLLFLCVISFMIILGRRGILVAPILFFGFVYIFYSLAIKRDKFTKLLNYYNVIIFAILVFVTFFGKSIAYQVFSGEVRATAGNKSSFICSTITKGHQEYDLFWPAVVNNYINNYSAYDFVPALFGNFISHENKLLNYPELYSITDKLMMEHQEYEFLYLKFGISPNFHQFYFSYLGVFSLIAIFFIALFMRKLEVEIIISFLRGKVFFGYSLYLFFQLIPSAMDYFLKYYIAQFLYLFCLVLVYSFYLKFITFLKKPLHSKGHNHENSLKI